MTHDRELDLKEAEEKKKAEAEELKKLNEQQDLEDFYAPGEMTSASNPSKCCTKLRITGTTNMDSWYQDMMGEFQIYKPMSYMEYLKQGNLTYDQYCIFLDRCYFLKSRDLWPCSDWGQQHKAWHNSPIYAEYQAQ